MSFFFCNWCCNHMSFLWKGFREREWWVPFSFFKLRDGCTLGWVIELGYFFLIYLLYFCCSSYKSITFSIIYFPFSPCFVFFCLFVWFVSFSELKKNCLFKTSNMYVCARKSTRIYVHVYMFICVYVCMAGLWLWVLPCVYVCIYIIIII